MGSCGVQSSSCGSSFHRTEDWSSSSKSYSSCSLESSRNTWKEKNRQKKGCLLPLWPQVCATHLMTAYLGGCPALERPTCSRVDCERLYSSRSKFCFTVGRHAQWGSQSLYSGSLPIPWLWSLCKQILHFAKKGETIFVSSTWGVAYLPWSTVRGWT